MSEDTMEAEPTKITRKRAPVRWVIQRLIKRDEHGHAWVDELSSPGVITDKESGKRWIRENGVEGQTYRVFAVSLETVVQVETKKVVTLA